MFKYFLSLLVFTFSIYAQSIYFSEEKYFDSLEMTFFKKGKIIFLKESIQINYNNDKTVLTYSGNLLIRQKGSDRTELDLRKKPDIKMFFILLEAIYFDKKKLLESNFTLKTIKGVTELIPDKNISLYIKSVKYKKKDNHLKFLKINMANNDRILIEEIY